MRVLYYVGETTRGWIILYRIFLGPGMDLGFQIPKRAINKRFNPRTLMLAIPKRARGVKLWDKNKLSESLEDWKEFEIRKSDFMSWVEGLRFHCFYSQKEFVIVKKLRV